MADQKVVVVILGINSRQGSSIARPLVSDPLIQLRGVTTDLSTSLSQSWLSQGIAMVQVPNYEDTAAMESAFQGAMAIFAMTDFYRHLHEHSTLTLADVWKKTPEEVAAQRELASGQTIIAAAAAIPSLKLFVLSSLSPACGETEDARGLQQFHSKAQIVQYLHISFPALAKKTSLLKPALYMSDWTMFLRRHRSDDGGQYFTFGTTLPSFRRLPWTHIANDISTLFQLCIKSRPGLNIAAVSDILSGADICRLVTETTGLPCEYVQYTPSELEHILGPPRGRIVVDMLEHLSRKRYYEERGIQLSHHVIKGRPDKEKFPLTTFGEFVKGELPGYLERLGREEEDMEEGKGDEGWSGCEGMAGEWLCMDGDE